MGLLTNITERLPSLSLWAAVDILLVAVLTYQFLLLIRGTRAAPMLVGVGALVLTFYVAHKTELRTLDWLVGNLLPYGIFALIVVFAGEIRQVLARIGRRLTFSRSAQASVSELYDDIILAANLFSQNQTGALIVIEREIGLRTFIESGVPLDAELSYDLLATIFRPSAPLHDGAVIIRKDRIAAAACFLPLTTNPSLSRQFGTRHRAAIGITEETDCLSLVVSEETGRISMAAYGDLTAGLNLRAVDERISTHFGVGQTGVRLAEEFAADIPMDNHPGEKKGPE